MKYRKLKGYKYQLLEGVFVETGWSLPEILSGNEEFVSLMPQGRLWIAKGYAWNGASGPTWDSESSMKASLVHDSLYQLMREKKLPTDLFRKKTDRLFHEILIQDGMLRPRARLWYWAVRMFAGKYAK